MRAVAEYLGHADPGFTLRVCAHLFLSSEDRARRAIDGVFSGQHARPAETSVRSVRSVARQPRL
jgi:hypothetical protein